MRKVSTSSPRPASDRVCTSTRHVIVYKRGRSRGGERSDLVDAAVDGDVGTGGEAAQVRRQEKCRVGDFFRCSVARHRDDAALVVLELSSAFGPANTMRATVSMPGVSVAPGLTALTRILRSRNSLAHVRANERTAALIAAYTPMPSAAASRGGRRVQDDRAAVVEQRQRLLHREDDALEVDTELVVQLFFGDVTDASDLEDRGVGEHHVDASAAVSDGGVEPIDVLRLAHVTLHAGGVVAEFLDRRVEFGLPAAGDEDVRALLDESLGGGETDAGAASGDDCRLACREVPLPYLS